MKYQRTMVSTLRAVIVLAAFLALLAAVILVPYFGKNISAVLQEYSYMFWPCVGFLWISAAGFLWALVLAWKITSNISAGESFSVKNADLLMSISRLALAECIWYAAGAVGLLVLNLLHPSLMVGLVLIEAIGICAVAVCSALSHLTEKAAGLQAENDLTI